MDACQFESGSDGWLISGTAILVDEGSVGRLSYEIACSNDWSSRSASVSGWTGDTRISLSLERRDAAAWFFTVDPFGVVEDYPGIWAAARNEAFG